MKNIVENHDISQRVKMSLEIVQQNNEKNQNQVNHN